MANKRPSSSVNVELPAELVDKLSAVAKLRGKSEWEVAVDMLKEHMTFKVLAPWIHDGELDEQAFRADIREGAKVLKQWGDENADAMEWMMDVSNPPKG